MPTRLYGKKNKQDYFLRILYTMKGRYVQLAGNGDPFDRHQLVDGVTKSGRHIPHGGVMLKNGTLAGYIHQYGGCDKTWTIIGQVDSSDLNTKHVPAYSSNGGNGGNGGNAGNGRTIPRSCSKNTTSKPVSLKTAVKMLRNYYRNNFN
jgi:hypothetical protein